MVVGKLSTRQGPFFLPHPSAVTPLHAFDLEPKLAEREPSIDSEETGVHTDADERLA
jgi:hypothetical protein